MYRKTGPNSAEFHFIEPICWSDVVANMQLYDFFTSYGVYPDLIRGCYVVENMDLFS